MVLLNEHLATSVSFSLIGSLVISSQKDSETWAVGTC